LITRFSVEQHLISDGEIHRLQSLHLKPLLRIGRDHCRYFCSDLSHVPKNKRSQALGNEVELKSAWDATSFCVSWVGGMAQVWLWNTDQVRSAILDQKAESSLPVDQNLICLPEIVFWPKQEKAGLYLLPLTTGFDLQLWDQGVLLSSQWFREEPGKLQQQRFARSQGVTLNDLPLQRITDLCLDFPWQDTLKPIWAHWFERKNQLLFAGLGISVLIASLQITSIIQWYSLNQSAEDEKANLEVSANVLLTARNQARDVHYQLMDLLRLFSSPPPLSVQSQVYRQLPRELGLKLVKWERNFDLVDMTVEGQVKDTLGLVKALSGNGLTEVQVEPARETDRYRVRLRVMGDVRRQEASQ